MDMKNTGCLLIHGFGGDLSEIDPLACLLKEQGFTIRCFQLPGHTGKRRDLGRADHLDWIAAAQNELEELQKSCEKVFIIGFSMGGLIAANLACDNTVTGIATLNSPIFCWNKRQILRNILKDFKSGEQDHLPRYLHSVVKFPLNALLQFNRLLRKTKKRLREVSCPVFIAQGLQDDTVSPKSAAYLLRTIGSHLKTIRYYKHSGHLICCGPDRYALFRDLMAFMSHHGELEQ